MKHKTILLLLLVLFGGQSILFAGEDDTLDTSFLGDTVLLFQTISVDDSSDINTINLLSAEGIETIIDDEGSSNTCGDISPDGSQISFHSTRDNNGESGGFPHNEIYVASIDGSGLQRLTFSDYDEITPRWSPDGEHIVFVRSMNTGDVNGSEIYLMDADGDNLEQLTDNDNAERYPSWSPDGERIIFHSNRDGDSELYTMSPQGDDVEQLTDNERLDGRAMYSPDGAFIVFSAGGEMEFPDLYVMVANGETEQRITDTPNREDFGAVWSPDGTMLAYTRTRDAAREIWRINPDGSPELILADAEFDFVVCDWNVSSD